MGRPIVLYILGAGSSGSTLLSMKLGTVSNIFNMGELSLLDRFIATERKCSCGVPMVRCSIWGDVINHVNATQTYLPLSPFPTERTFIYRRHSLLRDYHYSDIIKRNVEVFDAVSRITESPVLVDSSKDLPRFYYLAISGQVRLIPIVMVRNGLSYIDSRKRRGSSSIAAVARWKSKNGQVFRVLDRLRMRDSAIKISYEIFSTETDKVLSEVCERVGIQFQSRSLRESEHHNIGGMPKKETTVEINPANEWKTRIGLYQHAVFYLLGGSRTNRKLGIPKR